MKEKTFKRLSEKYLVIYKQNKDYVDFILYIEY